MKACAYIDGLNLYYRALRGTPYRWLNPRRLLECVLPISYDVVRIKMFTARVTGRADRDAPRRQQQYIRALSTIEDLEFVWGHMQHKKKWRPLVRPPRDGPRHVEVHDTEEKRTDVNLGAHVVFDACRGEYDALVIVTADTDLHEPLRLAHEHCTPKVVLVSPHDGDQPKLLSQAVDTVYSVQRRYLQQCQFPQSLLLHNGKRVHRPETWVGTA